MGRTKTWAIFLVAFTTILTSIGQFFFKKGANILSFNILDIITNHYLIIGLIIYALGAILVVIALKYGELSILYPIISLSYVWVNLISKYFFNEPIGILKWLGILSILIGVSFIGKGTTSEVAL